MLDPTSTKLCYYKNGLWAACNTTRDCRHGSPRPASEHGEFGTFNGSARICTLWEMDCYLVQLVLSRTLKEIDAWNLLMYRGRDLTPCFLVLKSR